MKIFLLVFFFLDCSLPVVLTGECALDKMATPNLKEIVIGKCLEYQIKINPNDFCNDRKDCNDIWLKFKAGFTNESLCNVSSSGFQEFLTATTHNIPRDKQIFWENVYALVHKYSESSARLITLEDTLTGYIVDTLKFCGDKNQQEGIAEGSQCPSFDSSDDCPMSAERAFWTLASREFAKKAAGGVTIMLNATADPIYSPETYFAVYEAPYLRQGIVTDANIILINEQPTRNSDSCSDPSLKALFSLLEQKEIQTTCEENPRLVLFVHCADNPTSPVCSWVAVSRAPEMRQYFVNILTPLGVFVTMELLKQIV